MWTWALLWPDRTRRWTRSLHYTGGNIPDSWRPAPRIIALVMVHTVTKVTLRYTLLKIGPGWTSRIRNIAKDNFTPIYLDILTGVPDLKVTWLLQHKRRLATCLILCLPLHDHDLPGQVAYDAGRGERRVAYLAEVLHLFIIEPFSSGSFTFLSLPCFSLWFFNLYYIFNQTVGIFLRWFYELSGFLLPLSLLVSREPRKRRPTRCRFPRRVDSAGPVSPTCTYSKAESWQRA